MTMDDTAATARKLKGKGGADREAPATDPAPTGGRPDAKAGGSRGAKNGREREERSGMRPESPEFGHPSHIEPPDSYSTESLDRATKAHLARFTLGISPFGLASTYYSWWLHLMGSPGKQAQLVEKAARKIARLMIHSAQTMREPDSAPCIEPLPHDHRFDDAGWRNWPYNMIYQSFLLTQQWWYNATNDIDGLSKQEERVVSFVTRQILDMLSPANFPWTNPEVARLTAEQGGRNLVRGFQNFVEDWERAISGKLPVGAEDYVPGRDVAVAEGKVVFRSRLIELIQYAPKTDKVKAEPILITPAWIMKYYILDLSPHNSLVKYLVGQGFTVFMISWRNPTAEDRDLGMDDYLQAVEDALDAVTAIVPDRKVHGVGYCLGGTLLTIKAAQMARDGDDRLKTLTLLATQTDFERPGELQLFVSESEVSFLEDMMWDQGYLDTKQMAGAFQLLRSKDLIWSQYIHEYLMGRRQEMFDLMAWNADATRMPYRMHSEYLRHIYLNNELAEGHYKVGSAPVALSDISVPVFCVSTTSDHVAPWHSVYQLHLLADTDITFVLTNGGHNAGIISEPGHDGREYQIRTTTRGARFRSPDAWRAEAERHEGSWWPELTDWLTAQSSGEDAPPRLGLTRGPYAAQADAPGTYVFQR
ncbi:PHA/PHB synthase family protein [Ostreiculturibacter nitratireducens]|uniref:PHA/PHB synthase family protein n=1 Tax=Ostreiculturibacter nitratireducens TaxID=3075226 RepID=UPI0031B57756